MHDDALARIRAEALSRHYRRVLNEDVIFDPKEAVDGAEVEFFASIAEIKRLHEEFGPVDAARAEAARKQWREEDAAAAAERRRQVQAAAANQEEPKAATATEKEEDAATPAKDVPGTQVSASFSTITPSPQQTSRDIGTQTHWSWMSA